MIGITTPFFIVDQYNFQVPSDYVGVPEERSATGGPLGHFVVYAGKNLDLIRVPTSRPKVIPTYCRPLTTAPIRIHGTVANLYQCSEGGDQTSVLLDAGHELLVWRQDGVTCEVSFHGHSQVNQDLDVAVARGTRMIYPSRS